MIDPAIARRVIQESDLSKRKRAILHEVVNYSYAIGKDWAIFEKLDDLVALTNTHRPDVSVALRELRTAQLIQQKTSRAELWVRFLPHGALSPAPLAVDPIAVAQIRRKLEHLNNCPPGYEPSTGQRILPLPSTIDEQVDDELADNSCQSAEKAAIVSKSLTPAPRSLVKPLTHSLVKMPAPRVARVHAGAHHEHKRSATQSMSGHVHAELSPEAEDLLSQINELTAAEVPEKFERTWRMRLRDGRQSEIAAFKAIGQVRLMKRHGEIRKSAGATLNYYFKLFRDGVTAARSDA